MILDYPQLFIDEDLVAQAAGRAGTVPPGGFLKWLFPEYRRQVMVEKSLREQGTSGSIRNDVQHILQLWQASGSSTLTLRLPIPHDEKAIISVINACGFKYKNRSIPPSKLDYIISI